MNSREKLIATLHHQDPGKIAFDLGSTKATGINASLLYKLRLLYGRDEPVKIYDTYQMLGLMDEQDAKLFGIDVVPIWSDMTVFGYRNDKWKPWTTPDGIPALVGEDCGMTQDSKYIYMHPQGDLSARPSGRLPLPNGHYFDYLTRQEEFDEDDLDGLADYKDQLDMMTIDDRTLEFYRQQAEYYYQNTDLGVVLNAEYGNLGSTTMLNGAYVKRTPGIRDFSEFLIAHYTSPEYIDEIYEAWTRLCIRNLELLWQAVGTRAQAVFLCGTDFGTQKSEVMSKKMFEDRYVPFFARINGWVHAHTPWKTLYHSCGSLVNIMDDMIGCGIDCLNPVQTSAHGMDPAFLKETFGDRITFWGGGVESQTTLNNGTPDDVERAMRKNIEIFSKNGGFVFSIVHNVQANVRMDNLRRILDVIQEYR